MSVSTKPKVFITRRVPESGPKLLTSACQVSQWDKDDPIPRAELLAGVRGVDALFCLLTEKIDAEVLDAAGPGLRVVGTMSVGYDHVDLKACAERGVKVGFTPNVLTNAVAELTVALLLATSRRLKEAVSCVCSNVHVVSIAVCVVCSSVHVVPTAMSYVCSNVHVASIAVSCVCSNVHVVSIAVCVVCSSVHVVPTAMSCVCSNVHVVSIAVSCVCSNVHVVSIAVSCVCSNVHVVHLQLYPVCAAMFMLYMYLQLCPVYAAMFMLYMYLQLYPVCAAAFTLYL
ncbi:hypothetical protein BaRGS_00013458 [Batillaria attramentaria]|uniref:D-isomer specific 2-hydroxyacid dehydrogenase catalytic domain-containing protein n=1 Tax=Batillaria attramentaria TaxID=370345 RepID=A0ABD0L7Q4_9CAEN